MRVYALGEIVRLKSGGPNMTVASVKTEPHKIYSCTWFDSDNKYNSFDFYSHEIESKNSDPIGFKKGKIT